ncbi:hypothetical protein QTP88_020885 [Uroleucon formosanum]
MDNAPYHSIKLEKCPTTNWKKANIIEWLQNKGEVIDNTMIIPKLLDMVKQLKPLASGGVATFIKDTIVSENITIISDLEAIATLVKLQKPLCISNIYVPDSNIFTKQHLKNIIKQLPKPFVILCDFNSRNSSWGYNFTDHRDQMVEEFLEEETLILLNNNEPTRHNVSNGNFSAIDLTITSINSTTLFDWQVLPAYSVPVLAHWNSLLKSSY